MDYIFEADSWGASFGIPVAVVSSYLKQCSESRLKVLLCIFSGGRKTTSQALADMCGITVDEAESAVAFWQSTGLISVKAPSGEELKPDTDEVHKFSGKNEPVSLVEAVKPTRNTPKTVVVKYSQREMQEKAENDAALKHLINEIQSSLQFSINGSELAKLVELYEFYRFDVPSILLAAEYCSSAGKRSIAYLYQVMKRWHEQDITSYADIEKAIIRFNEERSFENKVLKIFGVEGKPSKNQRDYIAKWLSMGFTAELLEIAYNKCMDANNKLSFRYIDGILNNWAKGGITTAAQVSQSDEKFRKKYAVKNQPPKETSYDLDEFESFAMNFRLSGTGKD